MSWIRRKLWVLAVGVLAGASGCNPLTLGFLTPVPVQPWVAERMEQKLNHKNDGRAPINAFIDVCLGNVKANEANGENGARVTETLDAMYRSAASGIGPRSNGG